MLSHAPISTEVFSRRHDVVGNLEQKHCGYAASNSTFIAKAKISVFTSLCITKAGAPPIYSEE